MDNYNLDDKPFNIDEYKMLFTNLQGPDKNITDTKKNNIEINENIEEKNPLLYNILHNSVHNKYTDIISVLTKSVKIKPEKKEKNVLKMYNEIQKKIKDTENNIEKLGRLEEVQHLDDLDTIKQLLSDDNSLMDNKVTDLFIDNMDPINILQKHIAVEEKNRKSFEIAQLLMGSTDPSKWLDGLKNTSNFKCDLNNNSMKCDIYKNLREIDVSLKYWQLTLEITVQLKQNKINLEKLFENLKLSENFINNYNKLIVTTVSMDDRKRDDSRKQSGQTRSRRGGAGYQQGNRQDNRQGNRQGNRRGDKPTNKVGDKTLSIKEYLNIISKEDVKKIKEYLQNILNNEIYHPYFNKNDKKLCDWVTAYKPIAKEERLHQTDGEVDFKEWESILGTRSTQIADPFTKVFYKYMLNPFNNTILDENDLTKKYDDIRKMYSTSRPYYEKYQAIDISEVSERLYENCSITWIDYIKNDFIKSLDNFKEFRKKIINNFIIYFKIYLQEIKDIREMLYDTFPFLTNHADKSSIKNKKSKRRSKKENENENENEKPKRKSTKSKSSKKESTKSKSTKSKSSKKELNVIESPNKLSTGNNITRNKIYGKSIKVDTR